MRSGAQYTADWAPRNLSSAPCVFPELVGPAWKINFLLKALARGYLTQKEGIE